MKNNLIILSVFLIFRKVYSDDETDFELPKKITCSATDLDLNECFKKAIQDQIPKLTKEYKNVPVLDPWKIDGDKLEAAYASIQANLTVKDLTVTGLSKTIINNVRAQMNNKGLVMKVDSLLPELIIEGKYKAHIQINDVAMKPNGFFNLTISAISNKVGIIGLFENRMDKKFLRLKKFSIDPDVADMKLYASGLWEEPSTNKLIVDFVNQYWRYFYQYFVTEGKDGWGILLKNITNSLLENIPFEN